MCVGNYTYKEGETKPINHQKRLIDSFQFMATSLSHLDGNLDKSALNNVKKYHTKNKPDLVIIKGVYPYEYMDSAEKLKETQLPSKEAHPDLMISILVMKIMLTRKTFGKNLI